MTPLLTMALQGSAFILLLWAASIAAIAWWWMNRSPAA